MIHGKSDLASAPHSEFSARLPSGDELRIRYSVGATMHVAVSVHAAAGWLRFGVWQHVVFGPNSTERVKVKVTPEVLHVGDAEIGGLAADVAGTVAAFFAQLPGFLLCDETVFPFRRVWTPAIPSSAGQSA